VKVFTESTCQKPVCFVSRSGSNSLSRFARSTVLSHLSNSQALCGLNRNRVPVATVREISKTSNLSGSAWGQEIVTGDRTTASLLGHDCANLMSAETHAVRVSCVEGLLGRGSVPSYLPYLLVVLVFLASVPAATSEEGLDRLEARDATNSSDRRSDSPWLQLRANETNWPPVIPTRPPSHVMQEPANLTDVVVLDVLSRQARTLVSQPSRSRSNTSAPFQGLLPAGETVQPSSIPDNRVRKTPTTSYPWRTIVKLLITAADGSHWGCSGGMVGSSSGHGFHVLTAGHCVYMHDHGGWVGSIKVIPALDESYMPFSYAWATMFRTYTGWTQYQMVEHDFAVLTLDRNIGDYTGWMGRNPTIQDLDALAPNNPLFIWGNSVHVALLSVQHVM